MPALMDPVFAVRSLQMSDTDDDAGTPEYSFAGYSVELSQKIALTPIAAHHQHRVKPTDAR